MTIRMKRLLFWSPRLLTILFAAFISLFALDVFAEAGGFWETTLALIMHLVPTFLILVVLAISWRREWIAAAVYIALAIYYVGSMWPKHQLKWLSAYFTIAGPLIVIGVLFLMNWLMRSRLRGESQAKL